MADASPSLALASTVELEVELAHFQAFRSVALDAGNLWRDLGVRRGENSPIERPVDR